MRVLRVSGLLQKIKVKGLIKCVMCVRFCNVLPHLFASAKKKTELLRLDRLAAGGMMAAQAAGIWRETKKCKSRGGGGVGGVCA